MVSGTGALEAFPTVTTTGCGPAASPDGTRNVICAVPIRLGASAAICTNAGTPPTVTLTGSTGFAWPDTAVVGAYAVFSAGVTSPTPVTYRVTCAGAFALASTASLNTPGAEAAIGSIHP